MQQIQYICSVFKLHFLNILKTKYKVTIPIYLDITIY
ncbi:hypothetical protein vBBak6_121 [Bacillus phage v_B-Bak6]|uniref:Uncharacterized protein n=1 Tax=Bacillus phage v_B-Bak10 TaxID=2094736 RepID=A0A385IK92_9CAUD|nr:hypothetical protein PP654_gp027 [Bacillus phage v_B-Bak10]AXY83081.1 hypothetical protein vBBak1_121 [Bacillus phage v_B-Bak1]AXY83201.1 hypothetical protein vBBak6_121 [Bacillus phage v_B-Bak6]AXY83311.1 hypothetical protein vBBBak10_115 [Bacillus phage v_B-Bak10]